MAETVNVHYAKTHLSKLLGRAEAGEEIVIARAGKPCARLVAVEAEASVRRPGRIPGIVLGPEFFEPLPEAEMAVWEGR